MFGKSIAKQSEGWASEKSARSERSISPQMDGAMTSITAAFADFELESHGV
jgi:hypothetical protein